MSFTLDPSATVMLQVQLLKESYSSGKFFVVNTPDSPLNSVTHCAERIGISYLVFTSMKMSIKDWFLKNRTKLHSVLLG